MKRLIVLSAPSGAGKTTLCRKLLSDFSRFTISVSTTTRAPRGLEKNGIDYFFTTPELFQAQISQNMFAEWAKVHNHFYGTSKKFITDSLAQGKIVLLDIDVQGAKSLRHIYGEELLCIFIAPPTVEDLRARLANRGTDSQDTIDRRIVNAEREMKQAHWFDFTLINDDLPKAYQALHQYISNALVDRSDG